MTVIALHPPDPERLYEVTWEMRSRLRSVGVDASPRILGFYQNGHWQAICGSHRIAAAQALGVPLTLVDVAPDEPLTEDAIIRAAGELLEDLPIGSTPREIIKERETLGSGVRYDFR